LFVFTKYYPGDQIKNIALCGLVAYVGERRGSDRVWGGGAEGRNHFEDLGVNGRIILK
jgi:hypothetical protein